MPVRVSPFLDSLELIRQTARSCFPGTPYDIPIRSAVIVELIVGQQSPKRLVACVGTVELSHPTNLRQVEEQRHPFYVAKHGQLIARANAGPQELHDRFVVGAVFQKLPFDDMVESVHVEIQVGPNQKAQQHGRGYLLAGRPFQPGDSNRAQQDDGRENLVVVAVERFRLPNSDGEQGRDQDHQPPQQGRLHPQT